MGGFDNHASLPGRGLKYGIIIYMASKIYKSVNLVANREGFDARFIDPELINAYGLTIYEKLLWVTANVGGKLIKYSREGRKKEPVITIPGVDGEISGPTAVIVNSTIGFAIAERVENIKPSALFFSSNEGTIGGYNKDVNLDHGIVKFISPDKAVYNGITLLDDKLYAADFGNNRIDVFGADFERIVKHGSYEFKYPGDQPKGYVVFNIVAIDGLLYVPYAKKKNTAPGYMSGPGLGFIAVYDDKGEFIKTLIGVDNHLDTPYSLVIAPKNFGKFSGKFLVGNFGAGKINAWDINDTGCPAKYLGKIEVKCGDGVKDFYINHLSTLVAYKRALFFCAGPNQKADGVVGKIMPL